MTTIACIGEAWGEAEARERTHFVGASGMELTRLLNEAGISRADCFLTNVFHLHPRGNDILELCGGKANAIPGYPALAKSKYVLEHYQSELDRLADELVSVNPNVVVALGNTPMWALLGRTGISKLRGTTTLSTHTVSGFKVLPTFHPAAVLRQWEMRPIVIADLIKAERESHSSELNRPSVFIHIDPTIEDLHTFYNQYIKDCSLLSVDIETKGQQITCIGFAPSTDRALVVPFWDHRKPNRSYWSNLGEELAAWDFVRMVCESDIPKVGQNILYDLAFTWRAYGIRIRKVLHDDMLLHHALQPEMKKGLGFMGSIYTDHGSWKHLREADETIKRDN